MNRRLPIIWYLGLLVILAIAHEMGHYIIYALCHPNYPVWIEVSLMGLQTKYYGIYDWARPWVFAGGMISSLPFLLLLPKLDWLSNSIIVGFVLYGLIETIWGLLL